MDLNNIFREAEAIVRDAGALVLGGLRLEKQIVNKQSIIDLVTEYDRQVEALIFSRLTAAFPTFGVVGEEGSSRDADGKYHWIVDPIDGTTNYVHGFPFFSVSLALYENDRPVIGIVFDPVHDELFHATAGQGAFLTAEGQSKRLHVSLTAALQQSLMSTGFPYDRRTNPKNNIQEFTNVLMSCQGMRRTGSAALDLAYVAAGRLDGYWEFHLNAWDAAAGVLLIMEAGGVVTMLSGAPFKIARKLELACSNGLIHEELLQLLHRAE